MAFNGASSANLPFTLSVDYIVLLISLIMQQRSGSKGTSFFNGNIKHFIYSIYQYCMCASVSRNVCLSRRCTYVDPLRLSAESKRCLENPRCCHPLLV